jgi:hypothetical protein
MNRHNVLRALASLVGGLWPHAKPSPSLFTFPNRPVMPHKVATFDGEPLVHEVLWGHSIDCTAERMVDLANENRRRVKATFNGIDLAAWPGRAPAAIVADFHAKHPAFRRSRRAPSWFPWFPSRRRRRKDRQL